MFCQYDDVFLHFISKHESLISKALSGTKAHSRSVIQVQFRTFHRSLTETLVLDSSPSTFHPAVMVAGLEHRFQSATTIRCPDKGPAHTWRTKLQLCYMPSVWKSIMPTCFCNHHNHVIIS